MTSYRILETEEFQGRLARLDAASKRRIETKLRDMVYPQLREQPFFGPNIKKLRGYTPDTWRYRIGNYRLFYTVPSDRLVVMLTLDDRKDAYK